MSISVRPATPDDLPLLAELIRDLAEYEKLLSECYATPEALRAGLFGPTPCAQALIGELNGKPEGFALFFTNFSTFLCKPGIYLEDLFVRPHARGHGLGKALLASLAKLAVQRGCGRLEWSVLDWNTPSIEFYKSLGAIQMDEWTVHRVTGPTLASLAALAP
jgi:GNAT superfamily N-acetyltransferase